MAGLRNPKALNVISSVRDWAIRQGDILAAAVVGSYARGTERPDSDVDLVLLVADPAPFLHRYRTGSRLSVLLHRSLAKTGAG